ncbi:hypothetical protein AKJ09_03906 [Labilithrix luteola]|uniref:Tryptophan synthase alpha chain n=1 Tax=Labilithrix luteola TaxID=1391654 RepID=A0A0K1PUP8_9BACT|nr:hypothetical protein [Labilithrix luteola]AKU97242.1 hypothetical protein AKJ09_03906 [Labilithrix luteola]
MRRSAKQALVVMAIAGLGASVACNVLSGADELRLTATACGDACGANAAAEVDPMDAGAPDVKIIVTSDGGSCACLGAPPPGWQGPMALWVGNTEPPGCDGDYPLKVLDTKSAPTAPPASCDCQCGVVTGASCPTSFTVDVFGNPQCSNSKCDTLTLSPMACVSAANKCFSANGISGAPQATGGSCKPTITKNVPLGTWANGVRGCEPAAAPTRESCGEGEVCAALPGMKMSSHPCVFAEGDLACPLEAGYTVKHLYFGGEDDSRGCSECTCGAPTGIVCTATVRKGCGAQGTVTLPTACGSLNDPINIQLTAAPVLDTSDAGCAPEGGAPIGEFKPTLPTTVCCIP